MKSTLMYFLYSVHADSHRPITTKQAKESGSRSLKVQMKDTSEELVYTQAKTELQKVSNSLSSHVE